MKTTYIYLNTYPNGYLYVGSHTWDGPEGELDPNYHGTSFVAKHYGWKPVKEEVIEVVKDSTLRREKYWIEWYAYHYGLAPCVKHITRYNREWIDKFKKGIVINCHANDTAQCHNKEEWEKSIKTRIELGITKAVTAKAQAVAHTKEVREKAVNTMKTNGTYGMIVKRMHDAAHTKEAARRQADSRIRNGTIAASIKAAHSDEAMKRAIATKKAKGTFLNSIKAAATPEARQKAIETRRMHARRAVHVLSGFVGCTPEMAEYLGVSINAASRIINRCFREGSCSYKGMEFKKYENA